MSKEIREKHLTLWQLCIVLVVVTCFIPAPKKGNTLFKVVLLHVILLNVYL